MLEIREGGLKRVRLTGWEEEEEKQSLDPGGRGAPSTQTTLLGVEKSTLNILSQGGEETGQESLDPGGRGAPSTQTTLLGVEKSTLNILGPDMKERDC